MMGQWMVVCCADVSVVVAMNQIQTPLFHLPRLSRSIRLGLATVMTFTSMGCATGLLNTGADNALTTKFRDLIKKDTKTVELDEDAIDEANKEAEENNFETKIETPLLGDYVSVSGNSAIPLRGVGLVTGLNLSLIHI